MRLNDYFIQPYREAEQIAHAFRMSPAGQRFDGRTVGVCIVAALCLSAIFYLGNVRVLNATLLGLGLNASVRGLQSAVAKFADQQFAELAWWAAVSVFFFLVLPALVIRCVWGEPLAEYGLRLRGAFKDIWLYLLMCAVMVPLVLFVSYAPGFQVRYPFYTVPPGISLFPRFYEWEAIYLLQFFALEFFFRGFLLHGHKYRFGYCAIFVSMMPYCMMHIFFQAACRNSGGHHRRLYPRSRQSQERLDRPRHAAALYGGAYDGCGRSLAEKYTLRARRGLE